MGKQFTEIIIVVPIFFLLTLSATVGYFFFRWSDDLAAKKKYWLPFLTVTGASYVTFFLIAARNRENPDTFVKIALGIALVTVVTAFTTRFCNQCSMMEVRRRRWFSEGDFCRRCGNDLSAQANAKK